jgi:hypothetical protein
MFTMSVLFYGRVHHIVRAQIIPTQENEILGFILDFSGEVRLLPQRAST